MGTGSPAARGNRSWTFVQRMGKLNAGVPSWTAKFRMLRFQFVSVHIRGVESEVLRLAGASGDFQKVT